jgi:hypothetical protein
MELDTILQKWNEAKKEKIRNEKLCVKYKNAVNNYMNKKNTDNLNSGKFSVFRNYTTRYQISKSEIPPEIWEKYKKQITYKTFRLKTLGS